MGKNSWYEVKRALDTENYILTPARGFSSRAFYAQVRLVMVYCSDLTNNYYVCFSVSDGEIEPMRKVRDRRCAPSIGS